MKNFLNSGGTRSSARVLVSRGRGEFRLRSQGNANVRQNLRAGRVRVSRRRGESAFGATRRAFQRGQG